jgi:hypothetical protein
MEPAESRTEPALPCWDLSRALFVRGVGLVYLCAFLSLGVQLPGLMGEHGILPASQLVEALHQYPDSSVFWPGPTLLWFGAGDGALRALWLGGAAAAVLTVSGLVPALALAVAWLLYLSLVTAGQTFLGFQWDGLLLETGFLAIFAAPWTLHLGGARSPRASRLMRWLLWWLAFRLFFFSGFVKLASGDPTWWGLTALEFHWWSQPLPTWTSWGAAQLPVVFDRVAVAVTLVIELGLPWLILFGRAGRIVACAGFAFLMAMIAATGNYGFFNPLALVICIPLLDDDAWQWVARLRRRKDADPGGDSTGQARRAPPRAQRVATALAVAFVVATSVPIALAQARLLRAPGDPLSDLCEVAQRYQIVNTYGLFARMTTTRDEIELEGTQDGVTWKPYVFPWKPGPVDRRPAFTGPHMPRFDWQMWFAALGPPRHSPWLWSVLRHLLLGTEPVLALFDTNPFPDAPPVAVRAVLYRYRFSDWKERAASGAWWTRELAGIYIPETRLTTNGGEIRP